MIIELKIVEEPLIMKLPKKNGVYRIEGEINVPAKISLTDIYV
jgi:hypothetical protein